MADHYPLLINGEIVPTTDEKLRGRSFTTDDVLDPDGSIQAWLDGGAVSDTSANAQAKHCPSCTCWPEGDVSP